jgi:DNA-binding transcriptional ArsR family regulator
MVSPAGKASSSSPPRADRVLGWMASLADATRVRLVRLLERHELGVVELCDVLQKPQPTVSRHLKVLGDQGWVSSRRQGTGRLYRTVLDELDPAARKLWGLTRDQTDDWPTVRQDELRLERVLHERAVDRDAFFAGGDEKRDGCAFRFTRAKSQLSRLPARNVIRPVSNLIYVSTVAYGNHSCCRHLPNVGDAQAFLAAAGTRQLDCSGSIRSSLGRFERFCHQKIF